MGKPIAVSKLIGWRIERDGRHIGDVWEEETTGGETIYVAATGYGPDSHLSGHLSLDEAMGLLSTLQPDPAAASEGM